MTPGVSEVDPDPATRRDRLVALSTRARNGDRAAITELVRELTPLLWHVARVQGVDRSTAEDTVQYAWVSLLTSGPDVRSPEALTSWLVTVTRRQATRLLLRSGRERSVEPHLLPDATSREPLPDRAAVDEDQRARLWRAVRQLSDRCRHLMRVIAFADRPDYAAVSRALGMPIGAIGPNRGRCLAKLRMLLASDPRWSTDEQPDG